MKIILGIALSVMLLGCDTKYTVDYAHKKYNEVVSEGRAYADSVKAVEDSLRIARKAHRDTADFDIYVHPTAEHCVYRNRRGDLQYRLKPSSNSCL